MYMSKAILLINLQNDFVTSGGSLVNSENCKALGRIKNLLKKTNADVIYYTLDSHSENYTETLEGKKLPIIHCTSGTYGCELNPDISQLIALDKFKIVRCFPKEAFGCFKIKDAIEKDNIDEIEIVGVSTGISVLSNAVILRSSFPNMKITVLEDCCSCVTPESHNAAIEILRLQLINIALSSSPI